MFLLQPLALPASDVQKNAKLFKAAKEGSVEAVQIAIANGADINAKHSANGETSLMIASHAGHAKIVKLLLEKGAMLMRRGQPTAQPPCG